MLLLRDRRRHLLIADGAAAHTYVRGARTFVFRVYVQHTPPVCLRRLHYSCLRHLHTGTAGYRCRPPSLALFFQWYDSVAVYLRYVNIGYDRSSVVL